MKWTLLMILGVFYFQLLRGQENRLEEILIESPALEKNLLGDPGSRYVSVYLPPSYFKDAQHRYPVVYFLHGNRVLSKERNILKISNAPIQNLLDSLIVGHKIEEMILVQPDARNFYGGCQYANSPVSGYWADFIVEELVAYVDHHYRTLAKPESRALVGASMGGRGVLDIALKNPGVYGVVYAMYPGQMGFQRLPRFGDIKHWRELLLAEDANPESGALRRLLGFSVAFSPNPQAGPYLADLPVYWTGDSLSYDMKVLERWSRFDPVEIAAKDASPLLKLNALFVDCGYRDPGLNAVQLFSSILASQNIPHLLELYEGGHGDPGARRIRTRVLPLISDNLVFH